jgi:WD40 repeat protein
MSMAAVLLSAVSFCAVLPGLPVNGQPGDKDEMPPAPGWRELSRWESLHEACLQFSPDGKTLATASDSIKLWNPTTGKELANFSAPRTWYQFIGFSADGKALAAREDASHPLAVALSQKPELTFLDVATGKPQATVKLPEPLQWLLRHPDGKTLLGWCRDTVKVWDMAGKELAVLGPPRQSMHQPVLSPDGAHLAVPWGGGFGRATEVEVWNLAAKEKLFSLQNAGRPQALAFSPDGRTLACGVNNSPALALWEMASAQVRGVLKTTRGRLCSVAFSPDGKTVAGGWRDFGPGERAGVVLWDLLSGRALGILKGHRGLVPCVAFSPDGRMMAASDAYGTIIVWQRE